MWCDEQGPMGSSTFIHSFIQQICIQCRALGLGERQAAAHKHTVGLDASAIGNRGVGEEAEAGGQGRPPGGGDT